MIPDFDLAECAKILLPPNTPIHASGIFYSCNLVTGECFHVDPNDQTVTVCGDYLYRGPKTYVCKHVRAGRICASGSVGIAEAWEWLLAFLKVRSAIILLTTDKLKLVV